LYNTGNLFALTYCFTSNSESLKFKILLFIYGICSKFDNLLKN
jgi:hypothetical protein